jgi:p-hydroxybenzoate 3-monooxygenase
VIHPQHLLVEQLCETLLARGGDVRFGGAVTGVDLGGTVSFVAADGTAAQLAAEVVVGCDGARSIVAAALTAAQVTEAELPVRLLGMIAPAPPLVAHTVYGAHPRGFAGQMRRGPQQTRYYLEVPGADTLEDWPEERCRAEVEERLGVVGRLAGVAMTDRTLFDLRVRVTEPMQQGRVFLAGDAAHLITPAGGKGMNLAIRDAIELAHGIAERFGPAGDGARLDRYSVTRLREIWRVQAFSAWFLNVMLANGAAGLAGGPWARGIRNGWVASLVADPMLARWFAHAYAGTEDLQA